MRQDHILDRRASDGQAIEQKQWRSKKCPIKAIIKKAPTDKERDQLEISLTQQASSERANMSLDEKNLAKLEAIATMTGASNIGLAAFLLDSTFGTLAKTGDQTHTHNVMMQGLYEMNPADATEGMLCSQAISLYAQGMDYLKRARNASTHEITNVYTNLATKLLRLQQETIEQLERYRRRGRQSIHVEHVHVHEGAQAIIGNVTAKGEGV